MTQKKTIALFGAGPGLGASLAARFGRAGFRVALVARNSASLAERVRELEQNGIEAGAFPADLSDPGTIPALVRSIEGKFGTIDVAVYSPLPDTPNFIPAAEVRAAAVLSMADLFFYSPIEMAHAVLPGMLQRGDGAMVIVGGLSAVVPMPGFALFSTVMAAVRNYALTLHAEVASQGVYAGSVSIGALIDHSAGKLALKAKGVTLDKAPTMDPDDLAEEIWMLISKRDRAEAILPPLSSMK